MSTPVSSVLLFVLAAALGAWGQYLYREGAGALSQGVLAFVTSPHMWGGVVCYVAVMALFVGAYRIGGSLAVLYPVYASTFVFGLLIAARTEGVRLSWVHAAGVVLLIGGMALLGAGQKKGAGPTPSAHQAASTRPAVSHPRG